MVIGRWARNLLVVALAAVWCVGCSDEPRSLAFRDARETPPLWADEEPSSTTQPPTAALGDATGSTAGSGTATQPEADDADAPAAATPLGRSQDDADNADPIAHLEFGEDIQDGLRDAFEEFTSEQIECIDAELSRLDTDATSSVPAVIVNVFARYCAPERVIDWWVGLAWHEGGINLRSLEARTCFARAVVGVANLNPLEGGRWFPSDRFDPPSTERFLVDEALKAACGMDSAAAVAAGLQTTGAVSLSADLAAYCAAVANRESTPGYEPGADAATTLAWLEREYFEFNALNPPIEIYSDHSIRLLAVREALFLAIDEGLTYDQIQADSGYRAYADSDSGLPARTRISQYERVNCIDRPEPGQWVPMIAARYDALTSTNPNFDEFSLGAQAACQALAAGDVVDTTNEPADVTAQIDQLLAQDCDLLVSATDADIGTPQKDAAYQAAVASLIDDRSFSEWDVMLDELHAALGLRRHDRASFERMAIDLCGEGIYAWQAQLDPRFNTAERAAVFQVVTHCELYDPAENLVGDTADAPAMVAFVNQLVAPGDLLILGEHTSDELVANALSEGEGRILIGMHPTDPFESVSGDEAALAVELTAHLADLGVAVGAQASCGAAIDIPFDGSEIGLGAGVVSIDSSTAPAVRLAIGFPGAVEDAVALGVASCN